MAGASRNLRGNAQRRRERRAWLVAQNVIGGRVKCFHCGVSMAPEDPWHVDRYPRCGHAGGRYVRSNIVIACAACNLTRCNTCGVDEIDPNDFRDDA